MGGGCLEIWKQDLLGMNELICLTWRSGYYLTMVVWAVLYTEGSEVNARIIEAKFIGNVGKNERKFSVLE